MPEHPEAAPDPEVLPEPLASRLLARASELEVARGDGSTVPALRAAAAEAGISGPAFDAALTELRDTGRLRTFGAKVERRSGPRPWAVAAVAAALIAAGVVAATRPTVPAGRTPLPPGIPTAGGVTAEAPAQAVVRSADGAPPVLMEVRSGGRLFAALDVAPGADGQRVGRIALASAEGTATTPAALEASEGVGAVTFQAPAGGPELELTVAGTSLRARGHAVRLVRDRPGGPLRAEVVSPLRQ